MTISILALAIGLAAAPAREQATASTPADVRPLLERIARGEELDAADATEALLRRITGPLDEALNAWEPGSIGAQLRVEAALGRLTARIRARLLRAGLAPEDRALFDAFARLYQPLVDQLFDDDPRRRLAALGQIPIERGTGAGLLALAKLNDSDEEVLTAAFDVVREFGDDPVVMRGLTRQLELTTRVLREGHYNRNEAWLAESLAVYAGEIVRVLGEQKHRPAVPVVVEALRFFQPTPLRLYFFHGLAKVHDRTEVLEALARMGDRRAAPALLELIGDPEITGTHALGPGRLVTRTVGDEALLALLRIFELEPAEFGFESGGERAVTGFPDDRARQKARNDFRLWYRANGGEPAGPAQAASRPSGG